MKLAEYKKINQPINKQATLCFLLKDNQVLLAMKKRGFGQGRFNGVGGKPNPNEEILDTAIRETQEEVGVIVKNLEKLATLDFYFQERPEWNQQVLVYVTRDWTGDLIETEEMKPQWFNQDNLPFDSMWPDDSYWLPLVLQNKIVNAEFLFGRDDVVLDYQINEI